jgi:uncharacterized protein
MGWIAAAVLLLAPQEFPRLAGPVTDAAGVLSPAQVREAEEISRALERSDSTQVVLLIVRTTGGRDIADYALEVGRLNGIGRAGKNNGALIVVAVADRRVRIEVGTGLEGKLTDALCSRIIRDEMVPHFRKGDYGSGALAGMRAVAAAVKGEYKADPNSAHSSRKLVIKLVFLAVVFVLVLSAFSRGGRGSGGGWGWFWGGYLLGGMSGGGGGGPGGGGGGSSWSGGGGSFGGGGASGSW